MKKITPIEIVILIIVIACLSLYLYPKIALSLEQKQYTRIQTNASMLTSKILSEFSNNKNKIPPSEFTKNLIEEMNKKVKNPIERKNPAYSITGECVGCVVINADDKLKTVTLTGKDKDNKLIVRTIIQPPSFVTYNKDFKKE